MSKISSVDDRHTATVSEGAAGSRRAYSPDSNVKPVGRAAGAVASVARSAVGVESVVVRDAHGSHVQDPAFGVLEDVGSVLGRDLFRELGLHRRHEQAVVLGKAPDEQAGQRPRHLQFDLFVRESERARVVPFDPRGGFPHPVGGFPQGGLDGQYLAAARNGDLCRAEVVVAPDERACEDRAVVQDRDRVGIRHDLVDTAVARQALDWLQSGRRGEAHRRLVGGRGILRGRVRLPAPFVRWFENGRHDFFGWSLSSMILSEAHDVRPGKSEPAFVSFSGIAGGDIRDTDSTSRVPDASTLTSLAEVHLLYKPCLSACSDWLATSVEFISDERLARAPHFSHKTRCWPHSFAPRRRSTPDIGCLSPGLCLGRTTVVD